MTTIDVSSETESSGTTRYYNNPPSWLTRSVVACPKCGAKRGGLCFGRQRRKQNHQERADAAKLILASEGRWPPPPRSLGA